MQLSKFTDYTFRALIYMATSKKELFTVEQLAEVLEVSEHHLKKVVYKLAQTQYVISMKGRGGGIKLAVPPEAINLGEVLRITEDNLYLVDCIHSGTVCNFLGDNTCKLKEIIMESTNKFIEEFSKYTIQDVLDGNAKEFYT